MFTTSHIQTSLNISNVIYIIRQKNIYIFISWPLYLDYVEEIFQTMVESIGTEKIKDAIDELNNQTPLPMNTMLDKQPREEAIAKKRRRDAMQLANVPPTNPGNPQ